MTTARNLPLRRTPAPCPRRKTPSLQVRWTLPSATRRPKRRPSLRRPATAPVLPPAPAPTSRCRRWASPSPRAPSPSGSSRSATPFERDEPLFEISTDKVDAEIPSPAAGMLTEIKFPEGATVTINTVVAVIGGGAVHLPQSRRSSGSRGCRSRTRSRFCTCSSRRRSLRRRAPALLAAGPQDRQGQQRRPRDQFPARAPPAASPSRTSLAHQRVGGANRASPPQQPRSPRAPAAPRRPPHLAPMPGELVPMTKMRSHHRASAWSSPSRPARTSTPSSRWT